MSDAGAAAPSGTVDDALRRRVDALPWLHSIDFGGGVTSPGIAKPGILEDFAAIMFRDGIVAGKSVLDIGCWDGFYSFEAHRRGARRILATDHFAWSEQCWGDRASFELARAHLAPAVEVMDIDLPELTPERVGRFDVVILAGVLYHLRHPFYMLERLARLATDTLIVETHLDAIDKAEPAMVFYPGAELANDPTNWWGPNAPCVTAMLKELGFAAVDEVHQLFYGPTRGIFRAFR